MKAFRAIRSVVAILLLGGFLGLFGSATAVGATVVIDPGHGGHDRGGLPGLKVAEKTVALAVARKTAERLREAGYHVVMTRNSEVFVGLRERCAIANSQSGAVFLSIHFNAAPRKTATGVETYYYSGQSARLAAAVHGEVLSVMGTENRGIRRRGFFVIRQTRIPAVLVEPGFLSNAPEASRINSSAFQSKLAGALARAVIKAH
jgi:N-acetylmuramoyl-L-alanine amidase